MQRRSPVTAAFTLIELLVVIAIIAILIGLLFPAFKAVQNQARQTQAKNDLTQIVNAVNAYYTEYGKYPLVTADATYGSTTIPNNDLFYTLRAVASGANANNVANTRQIVFINPPSVKNTATPRSGIGSDGNYYDPWGTQYWVRIDGGYDNSLANPYGNNQGAGPDPLSIGVIAWSLGLDQVLGSKPPANGNGIYTNSDDVISWQ
jgi:prepilin-type N-terminal cleavage/methylation domain-containing protein